jgi:hypothetical protein
MRPQPKRAFAPDDAAERAAGPVRNPKDAFEEPLVQPHARKSDSKAQRPKPFDKQGKPARHIPGGKKSHSRTGFAHRKKSG